MTERTKIERVGGHLLITGCDFINAATGERFTASSSYPVASLIVEEKSTHVTVSAMGVLGFFNVSGWTAREVLEVAYGGGEWLCHPKPTDETRALVDEIESQRETIRSLHTAIDDLTRAGLEMERAKNEEIAVLREALRRVLGHYIDEARNGDGIDENAWDDVAASMVLAKAEGPRFEESAIERGLAAIREAAGVER